MNAKTKINQRRLSISNNSFLIWQSYSKQTLDPEQWNMKFQYLLRPLSPQSFRFANTNESKTIANNNTTDNEKCERNA